MHVKTAGASGQSATVGDDMVDALGIPKDSVGLYKFTNPGNSSTTCVFYDAVGRNRGIIAT